MPPEGLLLQPFAILFTWGLFALIRSLEFNLVLLPSLVHMLLLYEILPRSEEVKVGSAEIGVCIESIPVRTEPGMGFI